MAKNATNTAATVGFEAKLWAAAEYIRGFCISMTLDDIREYGHALTHGRSIGAAIARTPEASRHGL